MLITPIILFLHGGPGSPVSSAAYYYQTKLESDYTIVNWDQRGSGRTYYENPNLHIETELSAEILLRDIDDLIGYLTERFGQNKVIIIGTSWGTILGSHYTLEHPEKVSAYIGVGQTVDTMAGEALAKETAMKRATANGDKAYIENLSALFNKFSSSKESDMISFVKMRGLISQYLSYDGEMSGLQIFWTGIISPDLSLRDISWQALNMNLKKHFQLQTPLLPYLFDFNLYESDTKYEVPVYFISEDNDWITPYPLVEEYYQTVEAPDKEMILIENTGHATFLDDPAAFAEAVRRVLD
ncbi:alpha/beta hydrolase [Bacillaceae bacterium Marseille-Q3522]|nr:alpha/beta hydrolase [Bacillaceae bacterium Marseille-Q3522]